MLGHEKREPRLEHQWSTRPAACPKPKARGYPLASPLAAMATAAAKANTTPESIIYTRISSANAMPEASGYPLASTGKGGKGNGSDARKGRGKGRGKVRSTSGYPLAEASGYPLAEASGYPLASTGKGGTGNGSDARKRRGKGRGKVRSKSKEEGGSSEAKQLALCHGYADYHDNIIEETFSESQAKVLTQHRSQTVLIESIDRLTRDPNDQRLPAHQGCKISSPALLPPLPVPDAAPATHVT